jgi:hypothetical protein
MGSVAKSYMRKGFLIYEEMRKYLTKYEEAVSHILYDFATDPFKIFMRKILFYFLSVWKEEHTRAGRDKGLGEGRQDNKERKE